MSDNRMDDIRDCVTAYDCRDHLPALSAWMEDQDLKQVLLWKGARFEPGHVYFDLDNPARGAFVATGDEKPPIDPTYACHDDVPERIWTKLITWMQPVSVSQAQALNMNEDAFDIEPEGSATGDGEPPLPR
ncbi:MAG: hypothetical protein IT305_18840 [Chloroflexi bacterium]|nr:hypothetical protein [Chloroflexota bacterium]